MIILTMTDVTPEQVNQMRGLVVGVVLTIVFVLIIIHRPKDP